MTSRTGKKLTRKVNIRAGERRLGKVLTKDEAAALKTIDVIETDRGQLTKKLLKEYDELLQKDLAKGNLSKTPSFKEWAVKKYGQTAYKAVMDTSSEFSQVKEFKLPSLVEARHTLTDRLVTEANKGEKLVTMQTILGKVKGVETKRIVGDLFNEYRPLLHDKEDKVRKVYDNIVGKDEIIEWPEKRTKYSKFARTPLEAMIAERTGASNLQFIRRVLEGGKFKSPGRPVRDYSKPRIYKPKYAYPKKLLDTAGRTGIIEFGKPFSEIIEEAKYRAGGGVQWSKTTLRPDAANTINSFALRHWDYHKKHKTLRSQIEFFWKKNNEPVEWDKIPRNKAGRKSLKGEQVFFKYTKDPLQREWDITKLRKEGRQTKLFQEVYAAKTEYNQLLSKRVPDPRNPNRKIPFETLMKRTYKKGYDQLGNVFAIDHAKLVADKPFNALRVASRRLNDQLSYISQHAKQKNFKKILMDSLDLTQLDDPLRAGQELSEKVLMEGYKSPLTGPQELGHQVLKKDLDKLSRPMVNQLVNLFSKHSKQDMVKPILDAAKLPGAKICNIVFGEGIRFGNVAGGPPGGCADEMAQALDENADGVFKKVADAKQKGGALGRASNWAKQVLSKIPKGGRVGAILAGTAAVGAGAYAMMGDAEADDSMHYNATEGKFVKADGDPETQQGVLNWIADHPIVSGLAPIPALAVAARKVPALGTFPAMVGPMLAAEKLHQYKQGTEGLSMATDPMNAIWAMGWDSAKTGMKPPNPATGFPGGAKWQYYNKLPESQKLGFKKLATKQGWKDLPKAMKTGILSPRAAGTKLVMPFGKKLASSGIMRGLGMAARVLPLGPLPLALGAAHFGYQKYADIRDTNVLLDQARASGRMSEEDADTLRTIMKQGWLGTTRLGAKLLGSEELDYKGQTLDLEAQKSILDQMLVDADAFQHGDPERGIEGRDVVRARSREDVLDFFSDGGRVGLKFGGMDRREFLKWLAGVTAGAYGTVKGMWKSGAKVAPKEIVEQAVKIPDGNPEMWIPRLIQKIKSEGKLLEMADRHYVQGDVYEATLKGEKVRLESNPASGENDIRWLAQDSFGDDMERVITFKEGKYIEPAKPGDKPIKEQAEFEFMQPNQSDPYRKDVDYFDWENESDGVLDSMKEWVGVEVKESAQSPVNTVAAGYDEFAEGGEVETGAIARRQSAVPPLSGPDPQGIVALLNQPKQVSIG